MRRNARTAGLVLFLGVTGWEPTPAQTPALLAVKVFLHDDGRVPADVVEKAKHAATGVFALSHIDLQWMGHGPYQPCSLTVRIVAQSLEAKDRSRFVMGMALETRVGRGILAFAYYDRIRLYSEDLGLDASRVLGHVMAHELGHLLLPHGAHSTTGVMRGAWDSAQAKLVSAGLLTFLPAEAALIQQRLSACASRIARE